MAPLTLTTTVVGISSIPYNGSLAVSIAATVAIFLTSFRLAAGKAVLHALLEEIGLPSLKLFAPVSILDTWLYGLWLRPSLSSCKERKKVFSDSSEACAFASRGRKRKFYLSDKHLYMCTYVCVYWLDAYLKMADGNNSQKQPLPQLNTLFGSYLVP